MKKEYSRPSLEVIEYVIDKSITMDLVSSLNGDAEDKDSFGDTWADI